MSKWLLVVLMCIAVFSSVQAFAQEEDVDYSWGTAKSVSSDQIIVTERGYDNDEYVDVEVIYSIDPAVELEGVESLKDIVTGDSLDIEYVIQGDKKVAKVVTVEKPSETGEQGEYVSSETYEEEWDQSLEESDSTETSELESE